MLSSERRRRIGDPHQCARRLVGHPGAPRGVGRLSLERRWTIIAVVVDRITIGPAVRGINRFDPERVDVVWRA